MTEPRWLTRAVIRAAYVLAAAVNQVTGGSQLGNNVLLLFSAGLLSALGPARRPLDVQPTEAPRGE